MRRALGAALAFGLMMAGPASGAETTRSLLEFDDLGGWAEDDHAAALDTFLETCPDLDAPDWSALCAYAQTKGAEAPRRFFELFFRPVLIEDGAPALFTGYFEPELAGSRHRTPRFRHPVHRKPPEVTRQSPWLTRQEIMTTGALDGRGLEIAFVDDPVELFFLQVQGSGRIHLRDGTLVRVGYAGANGHRYRSIGQELVRRGVYEPHQVSAQVIRSWVRRNPEAGRDLLFHNPSYVFFREVTEVPPDRGPLGAMNRSVTPLRTIAVDPAHVPLGAPVWIETEGERPMRRLMIAQDTGSAIKGAQRADIFFGTGAEAGRHAGRLSDPGRMVVLMPIQRAYAMLPEARR